MKVGSSESKRSSGGEIDGDGQRDRAGVPSRALGDGCPQHPFRDQTDVPGLLGERDELVRAEQAVLRMVPADERLGVHDAFGAHVDLRLKVQLQLVARDGLAQLHHQRQAAQLNARRGPAS